MKGDFRNIKPSEGGLGVVKVATDEDKQKAVELDLLN